MNPNAKKLFNENRVCFFCYWHGRILLFPRYMFTIGNFSAVISAHGDGEFVSQAVIAYGHKTVRGSSRKNNVQALMGIIKLIKAGISLGITPDGPKGPRFKIKGAIGDLAAKYDVPILPMTFSATKAVVFNSWDRFVMPIPFISRIVIETGEPIIIDKKTNEPNQKIQDIMLKQTQALDRELGLKIDY